MTAPVPPGLSGSPQTSTTDAPARLPGAGSPAGGVLQPVLAGVVASVTGFASAFAVILSGLLAAGATPGEAASGLLALCLAQGVLSIALSLASRQPLLFAWSMPGAALLAASAGSTRSFAAAIGAFVLCGVLLVLTGLLPALSRLVRRIPAPLTAAMLAGILLPLCLAPVRASIDTPLLAVPIVAVWLALARLAPRWAVPAALAVAVAGTAVLAVREGAVPVTGIPAPQFVLPAWEPLTIVSLGVPLYVVTMAGQNIPGLAVLASLGYDVVRVRSIFVGSGVATVLVAPFGGHAVNLAALSSAIVAGPGAHPDPRRRWIAAAAGGGVWEVLGVAAGAAVSLFSTSSPSLIEAAAGLALVGALAVSLGEAFSAGPLRTPAVATFVVAASGFVVAGVGSAFWALIVGAVAALVLRGRQAS